MNNRSWAPGLQGQGSPYCKNPSPYLQSPFLPCNNPFESSLCVLKKKKKKALGTIIQTITTVTRGKGGNCYD